MCSLILATDAVCAWSWPSPLSSASSAWSQMGQKAMTKRPSRSRSMSVAIRWDEMGESFITLNWTVVGTKFWQLQQSVRRFKVHFRLQKQFALCCAVQNYPHGAAVFVEKIMEDLV